MRIDIPDVKFDESCPACSGDGAIRLRHSLAPCSQCGGCGTVITTPGRELIRFLQKYYGLIPMQNIIAMVFDVEPSGFVRERTEKTFPNPALDHLV